MAGQRGRFADSPGYLDRSNRNTMVALVGEVVGMAGYSSGSLDVISLWGRLGQFHRFNPHSGEVPVFLIYETYRGEHRSPAVF
jgi:hypothetical protein